MFVLFHRNNLKYEKTDAAMQEESASICNFCSQNQNAFLSYLDQEDSLKEINQFWTLQEGWTVTGTRHLTMKPWNSTVYQLRGNSSPIANRGTGLRAHTAVSGEGTRSDVHLYLFKTQASFFLFSQETDHRCQPRHLLTANYQSRAKEKERLFT